MDVLYKNAFEKLNKFKSETKQPFDLALPKFMAILDKESAKLGIASDQLFSAWMNLGFEKKV